MLSKGEIIRIITDYIGVNDGYLGDFTYRTLDEFFPVYCNIIPDQSKLKGKTNRYRFQNFLENSSAEEQLKIIKGVFKKYPLEYFPEGDRPLKKTVYDDFQQVIYRLESYQPILSQEDVQAHFSQIQKQIIDAIKQAKHVIWVAVAWFTDKTIFNLLAHRRHEGLTVEVVLNDDHVNRNTGLDFEKYMTVYWAKSAQLMHNKFCVIDLDVCITGSYNWTNKANYSNIENITIKRGTQSVKDYANEFVKLKGEIIRKSKQISNA